MIVQLSAALFAHAVTPFQAAGTALTLLGVAADVSAGPKTPQGGGAVKIQKHGFPYLQQAKAAAAMSMT